MPDVASLGLEVQSADVVKATADLNKLSVAAAQAEANAAKLSRQKIDAQGTYAAAKAAQNLAKANDIAAKSAGNLSREEQEALRAARQAANAHAAGARAALERAKAEDTLAAAQARSAAAALREAQAQRGISRNTPLNDNDPMPARGPGSGRHNTANIMAQFQDIGVTAAMGMNPLTIALQQGTQLSAVLASMEKPLAGIAAGFAALLSPISLLTIAFIALIAAGLQFVEWTSAASSAVTWLAQNMQMLAPYIAAAAAALALMFGPAILGAIASATAFMVGYAAAATAAGVAAAAAWAMSLGPLGLVIAGLAAVVTAAYVFRDEIKQAIGVDVIEVFKVMGNTVIAISIGSVNGMIAAYKIIPGALGDLMIQAANAVIGATEMMVNAVISLVNQMLSAINSAMQSMPFGLGANFNIGAVGKVQFGDLSNPFAGKASELGSTISAEIDKASKTDWMGAIGKGIGDAADYASSKLKDLSGWLDKVDEKGKGKTKGAGKGKGAKGAGGGKSEAETYQDIVDAANRRIASLQAEYDSIGMTEEASAKMRYEQELMNQAQQKGIPLTDAQRQQLSGLAGEMANLEAKTKTAKEALDFAKDATKGFLSDLKDGLMNGESFWEAFGNAAMNVLDKITDKLLDEVVDALFTTGKAAGGLLGGGSGSGGGILGSLFGWLFSAKGNAFGAGGGLQKFANGGAFTNSIVSSPTLFKFAKGAGMMGEAGPEAIMPLSRDSRGRLGVSMHDGASGGGTQNVNVTAEVYMNDDGTWQARVVEIADDRAQRTTAAGIQAFSAHTLPARVQQINKSPRRRG